MNIEQFDSWHQEQLRPATAFSKPLIMGVINVTTDSFSDGGRFLSLDRACEHAFHLLSQGADLIDIGGESTKPGAEPISLEVELARVIPLIEQLRKHTNTVISIDTYKPEVMAAAVQAGANMINDVYALQQDGALSMAADLGVTVSLMHMKGHPKTMQQNPHYPNGVVDEVKNFFFERINACAQAGISREKIILDPGFGFGKTPANNLTLLYSLEQFSELSLPLLLGVSRKSTIGTLLDKGIGERLVGGIALTVYASLKGIKLIRTHDVEATNQALKMIEAVHHQVV